MGTPISGKYAKILADAAQVPEATGWKLQTKSNIHQYAASDVPGFKRTIAGVKSGSGSFTCLYAINDSILDTLEPGDLVAAQFYVDSSHYIDVDIRIENADIEGDINEGSPVPVNYTFVTHGAWDFTTLSDAQSGASDST